MLITDSDPTYTSRKELKLFELLLFLSLGFLSRFIFVINYTFQVFAVKLWAFNHSIFRD